MKMKSYLDKVNLILRNDPELWKLLYHMSKHGLDDPLEKEDILQRPVKEKNEIIDLRLKFTPVTDDLVQNPICRIIFYPSNRRSSNSFNYQTATQEITFDVFVHREFNDKDMRLAKICDRLNELLFDEKISKLGKIKFHDAKEHAFPDIGYIMYSMTYEFGSVN